MANIVNTKRLLLRYRIASVLTLILGLALSIVGFVVAESRERDAARQAFEEAALNVRAAIVLGLQRSIDQVESVGALFDSSNNTNGRQFDTFVAQLLARSHGIHAFEWIPRVPLAMRDSYERRAQETFHGFRFTEGNGQGQMIRAGEREEYFPVYFVKPMAGNAAAIGFDLGSNAARLAALTKARDTGQLVATERITLVQETGTQYGFLLFRPVYRSDFPKDTNTQRHTSLLGFALGVFRAGDVVGEALTHLESTGINAVVYDDSAPVSNRFLINWPSMTREDPSGADTAHVKFKFERTESFEFGGRHWRIVLTPGKDLYGTVLPRVPWVVLVVGILFSGLLSAYVAAARRHLREELESRDSRLVAEEMVRESSQQLRLITETITEVFWMTDVARARLIYVSPGYERVWKRTCKDLYENPSSFLDAIHPEDRERALAALAVQQTGEAFDYEYRIIWPDETVRWIWDRGFPVPVEAGPIERYVGVAQDVTERKRAEDNLRRFRIAMDATVDAIYLVDRASMRFVDLNAAACRMQSRNREELLEMGPEGVLSTSRAELERIYDSVIAGGAATEPLEMLRQRRDGSQAWVELRRQATRSAEGWMIVTVVRDITARKRAEQTARYRSVQQDLIASFGQQALASAHLDDLLSQAVVVATAGLHVGLCSVMLVAPDGHTLILKAGSGWEEGWMGRSINEFEPGTQNRFVLDAGEPIVVEDLARETRFVPSEILSAHRVHSGVEVPIGGAGSLVGILGAYSPEPRRFSPDSVNFLRSVANVIQTAFERKRAEEKLAYVAQFDAVTGLPNRHLFLDRLAQMLTLAQRNNWIVGVMFVDLDRFKVINDTYGRDAGNTLLRLVADRLREYVRPGDTVGHLGGDEFVVSLPALGKADDAALVARKVVDALARPFNLDDRIIYVTASLGVALFPSDGANAESLLKNADIAMYRAKEHGRNTYRFYLPQMNERAEKRLGMEMQLRNALERGEFLVHYQPKVNIASGEISGFEALLRWQHPERGLVPPLDFISILEDTGLIVPVGEWVVRTACQQLTQWRQTESLTARPIAVNLSARQFQQQDLDAVIGAILRDTGADPLLLEFELTESLLMNDPEDAVKVLKKMKANGVRLSVDDFGTGYSSLAYLKRFPLDALKIDRAFVRDVTTDPDDAVIALTIINLAHSLRLKVVAEGVETEAQLNFLRTHGCDEMQGYLFAPPVLAPACTRMLIDNRRLESPPRAELSDAPVMLLLDDDKEYLESLKQVLAPDGYHILSAGNVEAGFDAMATHPVQIVISDYRIPRMTGVEFLARVRMLYPHTVRILVSGVADMSTVTDAVNEAGIHKYLYKTWGVARMQAEVREAYRRYRKPLK